MAAQASGKAPLPTVQQDRLRHKFVMVMAGHLDASDVTLGNLWDVATMLVAAVRNGGDDGSN